MDTVVNRVMQLSKSQASKLAIISKDRSLTYAELSEKAIQMGSYLHLQGIRKGDIVLLSSISSWETVVAYLGIQYSGAVTVFVDKNADRKSIEKICNYMNAAMIITNEPVNKQSDAFRNFSMKEISNIKNITEVVSYVLPFESEVSEIIFTTGTTGNQKGVIHTYKSIYNILSNTIKGIGIGVEERILLPLPLHHSLALRVLRATLYQGATVILHNGVTFARDVENSLKKYQCTAMISVPAFLEILYEQFGEERLSKVLGNLRYIEIGAGSLTIEQRGRFLRLLPNTLLYNTWGSSETGGALFVNIAEAMKRNETCNTIGKPLSNIEIKVLNDDGIEIESGIHNPGHMALKGDMVMNGYWNNPELTRAALKNGWFVTNDMVYISNDKNIFFMGRSDDIINVGGEKVSSNYIENLVGLYRHIKECACIGVDDPKGMLGQVPILFFVKKDKFYSEEDFQQYLYKNLDSYSIPREYINVSLIPRNQMGKIDRKKLKKMWEDRKYD